ncbi:artemis protein [Ophiocordyceps camponoti-floridani]|uniref:Protein artemis n=1 Tax=Ophiocordyceps camponoti-floridani TaxID=2030778 RepID=A0A8H4QDX7_9HYPO|nr:artemis protein [Ophiocordyceps camponoti-floridani]
MSTFNGLVAEFPDIRIDFFRRHPTLSPPLACFLSHIHSDHLAGLESLRSPFVYCSAATREMLLRLERYPCRINYAKGILEARQQTYSHLARVLKPLPLETPTIMELRPGRRIRVTLFDANHCPGSVMFLIEGSGKSILYTGDVRSEPAFISGLARSPLLIEYCYGIRTLDTLYLDTSFIADVPFPPKAAGIAELIRAVSRYPDDTVFHIRAWTYGYEDVWIALSRALNSPIHVDDYKLRVYGALRARADHHLVAGAAALTGHMCGNTPHPGCLTSDTRVRLHSCERGNMCAVATDPSVVSIQPIVTRLADGEALAEQGVGGGGDDLEREAELAFFSTDDDVTALMDLISKSDSLDETQREGLKKAITDVRNKGRELPLNVAASSLDKENQARIQNALPRLISDGGGHAETGDDGETSGGLPRVIRFPYSRHSSYPELCQLVDLFKPHDVWPCTVNVERWKAQDVSIESLFGMFCSGKQAFAHDQMMAEGERTASQMECESRDDDDSQQTSISIASSRHPVSRNEAYLRMRANVSSDDGWRPIPLLSTDGGHDVAEREL